MPVLIAAGVLVFVAVVWLVGVLITYHDRLTWLERHVDGLEIRAGLRHVNEGRDG
jgi:hypothetical protein